MATSQETKNELEAERKKRLALEDVKKDLDNQLATLKQQTQQAHEQAEQDKHDKEQLTTDLKECKERLVNHTMDLHQLKEDIAHGVQSPSLSSSSSSSRPSLNRSSSDRGLNKQESDKDKSKSLNLGKNKGDDDHLEHVASKTAVTSTTHTEPQHRSWNKKVIYDMQEVTRQLNSEKRARRELEMWKAEHDEKMEEMKKKIRSEQDAKAKLEEQLKKVTRDLNEVKGEVKV